MQYTVDKRVYFLYSVLLTITARTQHHLSAAMPLDQLFMESASALTASSHGGWAHTMHLNRSSKARPTSGAISKPTPHTGPPRLLVIVQLLS